MADSKTQYLHKGARVINAAINESRLRRPDAMSTDGKTEIVMAKSTEWEKLAMAAASDFAPTKFALLREYYTPVAVAEAVADLPCAALQADRDSALQPSPGIERLVRALGGRSS